METFVSLNPSLPIPMPLWEDLPTEMQLAYGLAWSSGQSLHASK